MRDYLRPVIHGDNKWGFFVVVYALGLFIFLGFCVSPGILVNDEVGYLLSTVSLSRGNLAIWNGLEEYDSPELEFHSTRAVGDMLYGPMPLYPILMQPAYLLLGVRGLVLANTACFAGTVVLVYLISNATFGDTRFSAFSAVFFSLFTYSMMYGLEIWPHMLSTFLFLTALYLVLSGRQILLAGIVSGFDVGVRYPNFLLALLLAVYIYGKYGSGRVVRFFSGLALPLVSLLLLNYGIFGAFFKSFYNTGQSLNVFNPVTLTPYLSILAICFFSAYFLTYTYGVRKKSVLAAFLAVSLLLLILPALDSHFVGKLWTSMRIVYSDAIDMQNQPVDNQPANKKSILQASPILALCMLAPLLSKGKLNRMGLGILFGPFVVFALFYSCWPETHNDNLLFIRYLLESLPCLSILSSYVVWRLGDFSGGRPLSALYALSCTVLLFALGQSTIFDVGRSLLFFRSLPLLLSALLVVFGLLRLFTGRYVSFFSALILVSASYGLSVNLIDSITTVVVRDSNARLSAELSFVKNDSAIIYGFGTDSVHVGPLKIGKRIRLVDSSIDDVSSSAALMSFYYRRGVPVYLFDSNSSAAFSEFISTNMSLYGGRIVREENPKVYLVEAGV